MSRRLAESRRAVVTACTGTGHNSLMGVAGWLPGDGSMAGVTGLRGRNMGCRLGLCIEDNISAAVAGRAITGGNRTGRAAMVHHPGRKRHEAGVTGITLSSCWNVAARLTQRIGTIVTTGAATRGGRVCCCMVKSGGRPASR